MELTIEEVFRRGDQAYKEGNINEADKLFTAVLEAFPDHPEEPTIKPQTLASE